MMILVQRPAGPGAGAQQAEAEIAPLDGRGAPFATVLSENPLGASGAVASVASAGTRVVLPSGWLESDDDEEPGVDPRTWGPRGWAAFEAVCRALCVNLSDGSMPVSFRPRATDVLSDVPSCLRFIENKAGWGDALGRLGLLLDPAAMLTEGMLPSAEDHIARILENLAGRAAVGAVMLTNVEPPTRAGGPVRPSPLHRGLIPAPSLVRAARTLVPGATRIVLLADEVDRQVAMLAG